MLRGGSIRNTARSGISVAVTNSRNRCSDPSDGVIWRFNCCVSVGRRVHGAATIGARETSENKNGKTDRRYDEEKGAGWKVRESKNAESSRGNGVITVHV